MSVMPYKPLTLAGNTFEPVVSVPIPRGLNPAAMPTAGPEDEPPHHYLVNRREGMRQEVYIRVDHLLPGRLDGMGTLSGPHKRSNLSWYHSTWKLD